jgi:hypothetical protein
MKRLLLIGVALLAMLPATAAAHGRVRVFVGPAFGGYGWYGWRGLWAPYPYWGGYYPYGPYFAAPAAGQVKLETKVKDAEVFINGSLAGTVGQLKTMTLYPGSYQIEVRAPGRAPFKQRIYVVAGKTTKLHPDLGVVAAPGAKG